MRRNQIEKFWKEVELKNLEKQKEIELKDKERKEFQEKQRLEKIKCI